MKLPEIEEIVVHFKKGVLDKRNNLEFPHGYEKWIESNQKAYEVGRFFYIKWGESVDIRSIDWHTVRTELFD